MSSQWAIARESLRTAVWPIPLCMLLLAVVLFAAVLTLEERVPRQMLEGLWLHSGDGDDARNLLSTLFTGIITISSVVFSITIVALSLAANQFGSRLIRTYMLDSRTKLALGLFAMTIVYCLLGLSLLEQDMTPAEVPHLMVTAGTLLGLVCVLALLFFLHRVARSMVADEVIRRASAELDESIAELAPLNAKATAQPPQDLLPADFEQRSVLLTSDKEGYVEAVRYESLAAFAAQYGLVIRLDFRAGVFMHMKGWLGAVYPASAVTAEVLNVLRRCVLIGERRTPTQDLEFSMRHLVDIALRALSPGINDPNTALVVIDHLGGALSRLMERSLPGAVYRDEAMRVRVVGRANSYAGLFDAALFQIRQAAGAHPAVIINLLGTFGRIAEHTCLPEQREALLRHTQMIAAAGLRLAVEESDRADIQQAAEATREKLEQIARGHLSVVKDDASTAFRVDAGVSGSLT